MCVIDFEKLRVVEFFWLSKITLKCFDQLETIRLIDKFGKRF